MEKIILSSKPETWLKLNGIIYTARDQAHLRLCEAIRNNEKLPFEEENPILYYAGPSPTKPGQVIGACGPTTSSRMDPFTPFLMEHGFRICIGKGKRSPEVTAAIKKYHGVYLTALGGCGALYQTKIKSCKLIAYPELFSEAIYKLEVVDFPVFIETKG